MHNIKCIIVLFAFLCTSSCATNHSSSAQSISELDYTILFIGNSLTYTNNLPDLVKKRAEMEGINLDVEMIAKPNYAIIDHWNDGRIQELIADQKFNYVVVQQGPSSQAFGKKLLIEYGNKLSDLCSKYDAQLAYFMVWPSLNYYHTFEGVINNYREAAANNGSILLPVGEVWKEYFDKNKTFDYYGPDGFHPSQKGSHVAAEVIVEYLFSQV